MVVKLATANEALASPVVARVVSERDEIEGWGSSSRKTKQHEHEESLANKKKLKVAEEVLVAARRVQRAAQRMAQEGAEALREADESVAAAKKQVAELQQALAVDEGDAAAAESMQQGSLVKAPDETNEEQVDPGARHWAFFGTMPSPENGMVAQVGDVYSGFEGYQPELPEGAVWVAYKIQGRYKAVWDPAEAAKPVEAD